MKKNRVCISTKEYVELIDARNKLNAIGNLCSNESLKAQKKKFPYPSIYIEDICTITGWIYHTALTSYIERAEKIEKAQNEVKEGTENDTI